MDKVTCESGLALDTVTGGHPGPAALVGANLLPNVLDLQPGPWGEAWTGTGLDACAAEMLRNKGILVKLIPS